MFNRCSSLISLSDLSKWKINYEIDITGLFDWCCSLLSLHDISKWKIKENKENPFEIKNILGSNFSFLIINFKSIYYKKKLI